MSEHVIPAVVRTLGVQGFHAFRDKDEPDHAPSAPRFDTRREARRSHEEVVGFMRGTSGEPAGDSDAAGARIPTRRARTAAS
jgi:hypothetical protein